MSNVTHSTVTEIRNFLIIISTCLLNNFCMTDNSSLHTPHYIFSPSCALIKYKNYTNHLRTYSLTNTYLPHAYCESKPVLNYEAIKVSNSQYCRTRLTFPWHHHIKLVWWLAGFVDSAPKNFGVGPHFYIFIAIQFWSLLFLYVGTGDVFLLASKPLNSSFLSQRISVSWEIFLKINITILLPFLNYSTTPHYWLKDKIK